MLGNNRIVWKVHRLSRFCYKGKNRLNTMDIVDENVSKLNVSEKDPLKSLRLIKDSELYFSEGEWRAYQSTKDQSFSHFVYEV